MFPCSLKPLGGPHCSLLRVSKGDFGHLYGVKSVLTMEVATPLSLMVFGMYLFVLLFFGKSLFR